MVERIKNNEESYGVSTSRLKRLGTVAVLAGAFIYGGIVGCVEGNILKDEPGIESTPFEPGR
ncbi:hypothetical protein CR969_02090 [Candidatus Saccharibacteria bacterium]|nr:MAG: hypothetical protein CR969_02090 [Candidatus Saccharibacteria bacterium]